MVGASHRFYRPVCTMSKKNWSINSCIKSMLVSTCLISANFETFLLH